MTPTEINAHIGLPKQTVHRLCTTLEREGFLTRAEDGKRYRAGRRLRNMGSGLLYGTRPDITRHQILQSVARSVGETVNFVVPSEEGMRYIDRVETDWAFRVQLPVGTAVPFHCTASGKVFLAGLPEDERLRVVSALDLEALTPNTLVSHDALCEELADIAQKGYALDREEFMSGMQAIAVPVTTPDNRFAAALAFHGPVQRITLEAAMERLPTLQEGAARLSHALYA